MRRPSNSYAESKTQGSVYQCRRGPNYSKYLESCRRIQDRNSPGELAWVCIFVGSYAKSSEEKSTLKKIMNPVQLSNSLSALRAQFLISIGVHVPQVMVIEMN
jgi:hypothetical protein